MKSIILDIQSDVLDESVPIKSLLRKAYVVSTKLNITESRDWIDSELNGYKNGESVPEYRKIKGLLKCFNPYQGWVTVQIPDNSWDKSLTTRYFTQSIAEIEDLRNKYDDDFILYISGEPLKILQTVIGHDFEMALNISTTALVPILDSVRNTILQWALKLESEGILGEGLTFSREEVQKASMNTHINIQNFQGVLGDVENSSLDQHLNMTITQADDFEQLSKFLDENNVDSKDILSLKEAIEIDDKPIQSGKFGENVSNWIGRMLTKSADGTWNMAIGTAANLLATGISKYYGLS